MSSGLLIVDIQNDYFTGGAMELVDMEAAAERAATLLAALRDAGAPVIHVQHLAARPDATFFLPGTPGAEIHESVTPRAEEVVVRKHYPNSFRDTPLLDQVQAAGLDHLLICGAMSHMCIDATTRAAFDLGLRCTVVSDACATRDLAFNGETVPARAVHAAFMAALAVPYARVVTTSEAVASAN